MSLPSYPMTLREVASFLNVSDDVARYLFRNGKIKGFKVSGQWRAFSKAVVDYVVTQLAKP